MFQAISPWIEQHQRWFRFPLIVLMTCVAVMIALLHPDFPDQLELKILDEQFKIRGEISHDRRVIIVGVNNNDLSEIGRWPWSRDKIATIVDRIMGEYHAKALGFDIVFSEKQLNPIVESARLIEVKEHEENLVKLLLAHQAAGDVDGQLAAVLKKYQHQLVLGYFFYPQGVDAPELGLKRLPQQLALLKKSGISAKFSGDMPSYIPQLAAIEGNLPRFTEQTDVSGFFNFFPDTDGTVRRIPLIVQSGEHIYPSIELQLLRIFKDWPPVSVSIHDGEVESLMLGKQHIRTDVSGSMIINHYGPGYTFQHVSAADVLLGRIPKDTLKGAIVLLGVTAVGVFDYRPSPFDSVFPGVEGHAAAISNILNNEELSRPPYMNFIEFLLVVILGLLCGRLVMGRSPFTQSLVIFGIPCLLLGVSYWLFVTYGLWLEVMYMLLAILLTTVPVSLFQYIVESHKRAFIHDAFSHYLSPEVVDSLSKHPESLKLGGEEKELTAMFSDIASFSTFSEKLSAPELVTLLNTYLTAMSDIILKHGGTIDKYEGDAIIAFFGAPLDMDEHATACVLAAMEQQAVLAEMRKEWKKQGEPELTVRIGMNSGLMVVGNMGTDTHMNYTMMGDHVNLAARLEGVCKAYRTPILISADTQRLVCDKVFCRFVDQVLVVGRKTPVDLFEPMCSFNDMADEIVKRDAMYKRAWAMIQSRQFEGALNILKGLSGKFPEDGMYEVMMVRVEGYLSHPPAKDWDGVFVMACK
ncbi:MAG: adenylate/guanylate cyclase domain-containing protein [Mariprofundaceae bacterium]|nr:adenylate/guanylate cyclase domain-containing protein [Mariprofundaceae bacterium]